MSKQEYIQPTQWGLSAILLAYVIWGLFPLYWIPLMNYPADQMLAHRIIWGAVFAVCAVLLFRQTSALWKSMQSIHTLLIFSVCAMLLSVNWLTYLFAITSKQVLQASLGYFIAPLVSIFCGRLFLKEVLSISQYVAIGFASMGVLWLTVLGGAMPWYALILAVSWGVYGLLRKLAPLPALLGFTLETLLLLPFAVLFLLWQAQQGNLQFLELPILPFALLIGSGLITMIPLLLFAFGSKVIRLSTVGILQYITPTLQFVLGIFVFSELFDFHRFIGYLLVWCGVVLFIVSNVRQIRLEQKQKAEM